VGWLRRGERAESGLQVRLDKMLEIIKAKWLVENARY